MRLFEGPESVQNPAMLPDGITGPGDDKAEEHATQHAVLMGAGPAAGRCVHVRRGKACFFILKANYLNLYNL